MPSGNLTFRGEKARAYLNASTEKEYEFTVKARLQSVVKDEFGLSASFEITGIDPATDEATSRQVIESIRDSVL